MRRGASLLELLVVISVMGVLLAVGWVNFRSSGQRTTPQGLSQLVAAQLQAARMRALSHNTYVGVAFPSAGGTLGTARSCYILEGSAHGNWVRQVPFEGDFPGCEVFVGTWGAAATINRPATGLEAPNFKLSNWFAPASVPTDYLLVFTPSGTVVSNDLPLLNGRYCLVAGRLTRSSATGRPAGTSTVTPEPPYFKLDGIANPYTILVDPLGSVTVESGLDTPGSVAIDESGVPPAAGPVVGSAGGSNHAPVVENLTLSPSASNLPPGLQGAVGPEDFVRVTLYASDADGDPLTCNWTTDGGAFTSGNTTNMRWDPTLSRWTSTWTFRANPSDPDGQLYNLNCEVRDDKNALATAAAGVSLNQKLQLRAKNRMAWIEIPYNGLYTANEDGTDVKRVPLPIQADWASIRSDGQSILFTRQNTPEVQLWSVNVDGSNLRVLTNSVTGDSWAGRYSPDGTRIAFVSQRSTVKPLVYIMPANGEMDPTHPATPTQIALGYETFWQRPQWNAAGTKVAFSGNVAGDTANNSAFVYDTQTHITINVADPTTDALNLTGYVLSYCPDPAFPTTIVVSGMVSSTVGQLTLVTDDGLSRRPVSGVDPNIHNVSFTRDGKHIIYDGGAGLNMADIDVANAVVSNPRVVIPTRDPSLHYAVPCAW